MQRFELWITLATLLTLAAASPAFGAAPSTDTVYVGEGTTIEITGNRYGQNVLRTYCYEGKPRSLISLFETVEFQLNIANEDYSQYGGRTPQEVLEHYNDQRSLFSITLFSQKRQRVQLPPFDQQCIGIASRQPYNIILNQTKWDWWRVSQMILGMLIFWSAGKLAKNSVFYYIAGIVMGIFASLVIIIFFTSKLFPRRPMMYGVLIGGWTIGLFIIKQLTDNLRLILINYRDYVMWYMAITGLISFFVCYRVGPPKNPRSQHIIMWVLQAIGGAFIYFSSWHTPGCIFLMSALMVFYYMPRSLLRFGKQFYNRRFPPKRRLLTQKEYYEQTIKETSKSLSELRAYVTSPQCNQWSVARSLGNPQRFARFASGEPHLLDEEIDIYSRRLEDSLADEDPEEMLHYLRNNVSYRSFGGTLTQRDSINTHNSYHNGTDDSDSEDLST